MHCIQIDRLFGEAERFFSLPRDTKSKYCRTAESQNNGYVTLQEERYIHVFLVL